MYNLTLWQGCAMALAVVTGLSPWKSWFNTRLVQVGSVVGKVAMGLVFIHIFWFSLITIIPRLFRLIPSPTTDTILQQLTASLNNIFENKSNIQAHLNFVIFVKIGQLIRVWDALQWYNVHTKFCDNRSHSSKFETRNVTHNQHRDLASRYSFPIGN